jgi:hypothetical protein
MVSVLVLMNLFHSVRGPTAAAPARGCRAGRSRRVRTAAGRRAIR